jgi:hypothetical protein
MLSFQQQNFRRWTITFRPATRQQLRLLLGLERAWRVLPERSRDIINFPHDAACGVAVARSCDFHTCFENSKEVEMHATIKEKDV